MIRRVPEQPVPTFSRTVIVVIAAGFIVSLAISLTLASAYLIATVFAGLAQQQRLFTVEAFLCLVAGYYWLGLANPFQADVHDILLSPSVVLRLTGLIALGTLALWLGAVGGRKIANRSPLDEQRSIPVLVSGNYSRLYRAAYTTLVLGALVALACYAKLGVPALASSPDEARTTFVGALSPYTYYQWLFIDIGIALTVMLLANDSRQETRRQRALLALTATAAWLLLFGVFSRVAIAMPVLMAAVVWWTQGRRIPWIAVGIGLLGALLVVGLIWLARIRALGSGLVYQVYLESEMGPWGLARAVGAALTIFARTSTEVFGLFVRGDVPKLHGEIAFMSILALLPGKQSDLGLFRVTRLLGYDSEGGTTVSLFGGMYADFGVAGIVLAAPLVGFVLGFLERKAQRRDRLVGLYYAIAFAYYVTMIYGGQLLDVTLLWRLWLALLILGYVRHGVLVRSQLTLVHLAITGGLYLVGLAKLAAP